MSKRQEERYPDRLPEPHLPGIYTSRSGLIFSFHMQISRPILLVFALKKKM